MAQKKAEMGLQRKRKNNAVPVPQEEDDFNRRALMQIIATQNMTPVDTENVDEMERRFQAYLQYCLENNIKIGNMNAYRAIGITSAQVSQWTSGRGFENKRRTEFVKRVQEICASYRELLMQENKIPIPTGIFWQKNYDGLTDVSESIVHHEDTSIGNQSAEELEARYKDAIDAEFTEIPAEEKQGRKAQKKKGSSR